MKKSIKYFLLGASTVIIGLAVYTFLHEPTNNCETEPVKKSDATGTDHAARRTVTLNKEFVERRRELARKRAAERAASIVAATSAVGPDKTVGDTEDSAKENSLRSKEIKEATQGNNILLIETKSIEECKDDNSKHE
ncbi:MAG: hypothetical protein ACLUFH_07015 [Monoglobales bacterium]